MKVKTIYYSSHFAKAFKKLAKDIQEKASEKDLLFRADCFDPRLETHKLKGDLKNYWSFSVTQKVRILFEFMENGEVSFIDIDDHDVYKRR